MVTRRQDGKWKLPENSLMLRKTNRKRILKLLHGEWIMTNKEIADALNLSIPTVIQIVDSLIEDGLLVEAGVARSTGGRRPRSVCFEPAARAAVGIEIHRDGYIIIGTNLLSTIFAQKKYAVPFEPSDKYWKDMAANLEVLLDSSRIERGRVLGAGISFDGAVSRNGRHVVFPSHQNIPTIQINMLKKQFPYPLLIINSTFASCYTDSWNRKRFYIMFYLDVSDEITGATIINNELFTGANNRAGDIGHSILEIGGKPCKCGRQGCMEAYCSTRCLTEPFNETLQAFFLALDKEDEAHKAIWKEYIQYLAVGIINLRKLFDMAIILGGKLGEYIGNYLDDLRQEARDKADDIADPSVYLDVAINHHNTAAIGAALQIINEFLAD